jgi:nucleotide-binding universal stress UspA family protein
VTKCILAATDLSEASNEALRQAHACAVAFGAKLSVCHVLPNLLGINTLFPQRNQSTSLQVTEIEAKVRGLVEQQVATCMPKSNPEIFVDQGSDYAGIIRRAEALSADLIVVGSYGRTGLAALQLGSVSTHVVRHAHCAVLVARPTSNRGVVLAATDLSDPSMPAVAAAAEQARSRNAKLVVMHAIDFASVAVNLEEMVLGAMLDSARNVDQVLREGLAEKLREAIQHCVATGDVHVTQGSPAAAIVRSADQLGAELLVVGTRGRTGLVRLALGSVAERVIRTASCSVLAVRLAV